jgi:hypothetical protein
MARNEKEIEQMILHMKAEKYAKAWIGPSQDVAVRDSFLVFFRTSPITGATG